MLTADENARLTEVGPGTPMGALLRRYWQPIAAVAEMEERSVKPVRLLGEDLVLYRDLSGTYGLLGRHCPHRRADLSRGFVEQVGLRCSYHGWKYGELGTCLEQPFEDVVNSHSNLREKVRLPAYRVEKQAGLLWVYMGPAPAPLVPNWEAFGYDDCFVQIAMAEIPCNWLQCQENSIDPVHVEWQHMNWSLALQGKSDRRVPAHLRVEFEEFEFGFIYRRILENTGDDDEHWRIGRLCVLPNLFVPHHYEWRVPVDDYNTLAVVWHFTEVPEDRRPFRQERIPYWYGTVTDPVTGTNRGAHVINQDAVAWIGQGRVSDRTQEQLGESDRGVVMLREQLQRDLEAVARGDDPKGLIRDQDRNRSLIWPNAEERRRLRTRFTIQQWRRMLGELSSILPSNDVFFLLDGQPEEVRTEFEVAMGIRSSS